MKQFSTALFIVTLLSSRCLAEQAKITLVTEHLPPYQIIKDDSSVIGFATDVVLELFKRTQIDYSLHGYPWVRTYNLALKKSNHCIFSIARIPSREKLFKWIGPITEKTGAVIWSLKSNIHSKEIKSLDDLKYYITAVNRSDVTHTAMLELGLVENENLYVLEDNKSLINFLVSRPEVDFIVGSDITIPNRAKLAGVPMDLLQRVIEVDSLYLNFFLACNINTDKDIIKKLTINLKDMHQDGSYQKILTRWKSEMPHLQ